MKKILAFVAAVLMFGVMFLPPTARAEDCTSLDLGPLLSVTVDCQVVNTLGAVVGEVTDVTNGVVEIVREVPVPGPVTTVPAPAPAPVTVTRTPAPATVTRTPAPATVTESSEATVTATVTTTTTATPTRATVTVTPSGQETTGRDTVALPELSGPVDIEGAGPIPDDPEEAAAAGSIFGLILGIILGLVGLFIAYRRGQKDGEKATLAEFLGVIRGEPVGPKHRA